MTKFTEKTFFQAIKEQIFRTAVFQWEKNIHPTELKTLIYRSDLCYNS